MLEAAVDEYLGQLSNTPLSKLPLPPFFYSTTLAWLDVRAQGQLFL